jgi:hypothetical protein
MNTNNIFDAKVLGSFTKEGLSHKIELFSGACNLFGSTGTQQGGYVLVYCNRFQSAAVLPSVP